MATRGTKKNRVQHRAPASRSPIDDYKLILRAGLILALGILIYLPSLSGEWLWDDRELIADSVLIHDPDGLRKIWFEPATCLFDYMPLKVSVEWIEWRLFGEDTSGYHVVSLVLHLLSAFLLWRLLAKFGLRHAWVGGLIFAVHPVLVESVAWIAELKNTLSLPFFLLAMSALIDFDTRGKRRDYITALIFFLLALWTKPTMVMFPFVILLYAWWKRRRIGWKDLEISLPFFAISVAIGMATLWFLHRTPGEQAVVLGEPLSRLACAGLSIAFYFSKCVLPVNLMTIYPQWTVDPPSPLQFLPWPVLAGVLWFLWTKRAGWGRHALLGLGFFLIILTPFLGLNAGSYMNYTWVMDHLLYIPIIGLIGLAVAGWEQMEAQLAVAPRRIGVGIAAVLLALMAWSSWGYAQLYSSLEGLWRYNTAVNPAAAMPHNDLGVALVRKERSAEALDEFRIATLLNPSYSDAHRNFGISLFQAGRIAESTAQFQELVRLSPRVADAHYHLALALGSLGRAAESDDQYRQAIALDPHYIDAYNNLAVSLAEQNRAPEAIQLLQTAAQIDPSNQQIQGNLAKLLATKSNASTKQSQK